MKKLWLLSALFIFGCQQTGEQHVDYGNIEPYANPSFASYWDQGKAELTSYDLQQYRYGQKRQGEAVLVFVTEDFYRQEQVKLDNPQRASDAVHVLKLNFTKKFITGIYPYSMMMSSFFPLDGSGLPIKITTTSQEWCGHTFTQLNKTSKGYAGKMYSYFEAEGDDSFSLSDSAIPEDGIWNMLRISPESLPTGDVIMLPGTMYQRLSHQPLVPVKASCSLSEEDSLGLRHYSIEYSTLNRKLTINFKNDFPYRIVGWTDAYPSFNSNEQLKTVAVLRAQVMLDYWNHNNIKDSIWRDSLNLRY